jgi:TPP-dependent pyruvate/acetoin dehydrogenase alpha subunit
MEKLGRLMTIDKPEELKISPEIARKLHFLMVKIRIFEERVREALFNNEIRTPCHLYLGEEAVAAGVCINLKPDDYIFSNHRSHGHYIAKGGEINPLMAEIFARETGCSRGRGGSMHVCAPEVGLLGTSALVAGGIPVAVGAALGAKHMKNGRIAVSFFGDGATEEGPFHESLLFASFHKLPVLFVIENNLISTHLPLVDRQPDDNLFRYADSYGIESKQIDGNDALSVYYAAREAVEHVRQNKGPYLLECRVNRWVGHVGPNWDYTIGFRSEELVKAYLADDPIKNFEEYLITEGISSQEHIQSIHLEVRKEVEDSYEFAISSPYPNPADIDKYVFFRPDSQINLPKN